ncbi:hypothetical protein PRIPAC_74614, partial [Pristionchus pacificus]|uniref:Uncharacterized protein n=1 Tax=Pristionchus pacificus TaxID=54126 RepID=A0A2A6C0X0_PRIPA
NSVPVLLPFKRWLLQQEDSKTDDDGVAEYAEYKLEHKNSVPLLALLLLPYVKDGSSCLPSATLIARDRPRRFGRRCDEVAFRRQIRFAVRPSHRAPFHECLWPPSSHSFHSRPGSLSRRSHLASVDEWP